MSYTLIYLDSKHKAASSLASLSNSKETAVAGPKRNGKGKRCVSHAFWPIYEIAESQWKQNKNVLKRREKDLLALEEANTREHNRTAHLMAKAKIYEAARKDGGVGLTEAQRASLNVDFEAKQRQDWDALDRDQSLAVPGQDASEDDDSSDYDSDDAKPVGNEPLVEVQDEFGRARMVPRSQAAKFHKEEPPQALLSEDDGPDPDNVIRDDNYFPTYEFTQEELQARQRKLAEADLPVHYDATTEIRARGAAQYTFSKDEAEREAQMAAIKNGHETVERGRRAVEVAERQTQTEAEERRKAIADKKRKAQARLAEREARQSKAAKTEPA